MKTSKRGPGRPPIYPQIAKKMKRGEMVQVPSKAENLNSHTLCKELKKLGRVPQYKRVRGKWNIWWE